MQKADDMKSATGDERSSSLCTIYKKERRDTAARFKTANGRYRCTWLYIFGPRAAIALLLFPPQGIERRIHTVSVTYVL